MSQSKATPRPWRHTPTDESGFYITTENMDVVAYCQRGHIDLISENQANAELIARAVNCHDELVKAVENLLAIFENEDPDCEPSDKIRSLLKRARGES